MGNAASTNARLAGFSSLVGELGDDVQYDRSMGDSRFLKTIKARHPKGPIVVKTFYKPSDPSESASLSLDDLVRRLRDERLRLADAPNVLAYQTIIETENAGYMARQWLASSMYDRISTRPFLAPIEKKWLVFQLLQGMATATARKVPHGDLKTQNLLVTSSLSLYITDFASCIKPTYLPLEDPDDFGVFFDTAGRRVCYLAPERFFDSDSSIAKERAAQRTASQKRMTAAAGAGGTLSAAPPGTWSAAMPDPFNVILGNGGQKGKEGGVTEAMDVFSAGCVIAELWRDGTPTLQLRELFQYRRGEIDLEPVLKAIDDTDIRAMVRKMIALDPAQRGSFIDHIEEQQGKAFPRLFYDFCYPYLTSLQRSRAAPSARPSGQAGRAESGSSTVKSGAPSVRVVTGDTESEQSSRNAGYAAATASLSSESDERLETLYEEWSLISDSLVESTSGADYQRWLNATVKLGEPTASEDPRRIADCVYPVALHIPGVPAHALRVRVKSPDRDGPALILLSIILSNLRNASRPSIRQQALELCMHLANGHLTDVTKLDRLLPYIIALFDDPAPPVRVAACRAATQVLLLVDSVDAANATIFSEYVVPQFRHLASDPCVFVRAAYAASLAHLCHLAHDHVARIQAAEQEQQLSSSKTAGPDADLHDSQQEILHNLFQVEVVSLLTDPAPIVKITLLADIDKLTSYFDAAVTNDILLSHMITYLNDKDWRLRQSFFEAILHLGSVASSGSIEKYILPLMLQALNDGEETVVLRVLEGLTSIVSTRRLPTACIYEVFEVTAGFLCHPNQWLRHEASSLLRVCMRSMREPERWAFAYPHIRPLLAADIPDISEESLLGALKPPVPRIVFSGAVAWAAKVRSSLFWKAPDAAKSQWPIDNTLGHQGLALMAGRVDVDVPQLQVGRNEEDDGHLDRLRALGMSKDDEIKLIALRSVVRRLARQGSSQIRNPAQIQAQHDAPLISGRQGVTTLEGVNSQNIFFNTKTMQPSSSQSEEASVVSRSRTSDRASSFARQLARKRIAGRLASEASHLYADDSRRERLQAFFNREAGLPDSNKDGDGASDTTATLRSPGGSSPREGGLRPLTPGFLMSSIRDRDSDAGHEKSSQHTAEEEPALSTYSGKDPYMRAHLEFVHQHRSRMRASVVTSRRLHGAKTRRRNPGGASRQDAPSNSRPDGKLVAYFTEHVGAITALAVSLDHTFFVTGSEDSTLRVWDTARLERNVTSRSRALYNGHNAGITSCIALSQPRCFASTSKDGSLHVWRVDVRSTPSMPKYGSSPKLLSNFQFSDPLEHATCVLETTFEGAAALVMGTTHGRITIVDLRTMQVLRTLQNAVHLAAVVSICEDPQRQWLLSATSSGHLCLWDMRFGLLIRTFRALDAHQEQHYRISICANHPRADRQNVVLVGIASLDNQPSCRAPAPLIEMWDVQRAAKIATFETGTAKHLAQQRARERDPAPEEIAPSSPAAAIEALLTATSSTGPFLADDSPATEEFPRPVGAEASLALAPSADCATLVASIEGYRSSVAAVKGLGQDWVDAGAVVSGVGLSPATSAGWVLTAGADRAIRWWDLGQAERSKTVSPIQVKDEFKSTKNNGMLGYLHTVTPSTKSDKPTRSILLSPAQSRESHDVMNLHRDAITALAVLESPFRCVVAGDHSGRIMVWE